jgi:hypothetical protein
MEGRAGRLPVLVAVLVLVLVPVRVPVAVGVRVIGHLVSSGA